MWGVELVSGSIHTTVPSRTSEENITKPSEDDQHCQPQTFKYHESGPRKIKRFFKCWILSWFLSLRGTLGSLFQAFLLRARKLVFSNTTWDSHIITQYHEIGNKISGVGNPGWFSSQLHEFYIGLALLTSIELFPICLSVRQRRIKSFTLEE